MDAVQLGPRDVLGYRRPAVTASFEDLRRRGLPEVLFVHSFLPVQESAHWQQAALALVEAAAAANPKILGPYARSVLGPANNDPSTRGWRRVPGGWAPPVPPDR